MHQRLEYFRKKFTETENNDDGLEEYIRKKQMLKSLSNRKSKVSSLLLRFLSKSQDKRLKEVTGKINRKTDVTYMI